MNIRKVIKIMSIDLEKDWIWYIVGALFYTVISTFTWIDSKDMDSYINSTGYIVVPIFMGPMMLILRAMMRKNNKMDKEVEAIISILPVENEERILGRLINSGSMLYMLIIPYITMYIFTPSVTQRIGIRGGVTLIIIYLLVWSTIRNISKYNKKYKILNKPLGILFIIIFYLPFGIGFMAPLKDIFEYLYNSEAFIIIGNTYVGIILGIVTLMGFYYFNFTYVLKGIKNNRWQIR